MSIKKLTSMSRLTVCIILLLALTVVTWYRTYTNSGRIKKVISNCLLGSIQSAQFTGPWLDKNDNPTSIKVADMKSDEAQRTARDAFLTSLILEQSSLPTYKITSLTWVNGFSSVPEILAHADVQIPIIFGWTVSVRVDERYIVNSTE